jgi:methylphosphotriester-DNA--protein-cysteine methyltransferase
VIENQAKDSMKAAQDRRVPDDLLQKLHLAGEHLHRSRQLLEEAMDDTEYAHQERLDQMTDQLRAAEREVEEISLKIHSSLAPPPPAENPQH